MASWKSMKAYIFGRLILKMSPEEMGHLLR
jgi:hypothetical protein